MHTYNGVVIVPNKPFKIDGKQYPANWLQLAKPADLIAAGIVYTPDPPQSLAEAKADKRRELKAALTAALAVDVPAVGNRTWPSDDAFKARLTSLISRAARGKPAPAKLRGSSGAAINTPTLAQLETIEDAIVGQEETALGNYWLKIDAVQGATTIEEIATITW